ncbi:MAG: type 4a pilus biogenesis protein PilO [Micrococcales bacterium]|nr:type 4a pilus biogenesis protein PilO [Micrococcales bacterium]
MKLDNRLTMLLVGIIAVALLAGGWFLGVQPQLAAATTADAQRATATTQNEATTAQIAQLARQKAKLPELKAQLAALSAAVPATADTTAFLRTVSSLTASTGVKLVSFAPSPATAYVPPAGSAPAAPSTGTTGASSSSSASPSAAPSASAAATPAVPAAPAGAPYSDPAVTPENFTVIGFSISVTGSESAIDSFLNSLRNTGRLVLLTSINKSVSQGNGGVSSWSLTVSGNLYALKDAATTAAAAGASANG